MVLHVSHFSKGQIQIDSRIWALVLRAGQAPKGFNFVEDGSGLSAGICSEENAWESANFNMHFTGVLSFF
jgi:hypothetical protein